MTIDASGFSGSVTLDGGSETYFVDLHEDGLGTTDEQTIDLNKHAATTNLSELNNGDGVTMVTGIDFQIALVDGTTVDVDISAATTVQALLEAINDAAAAKNVSDRLVATVTDTGETIRLVDTGDGTHDLEVTALNESPAAEDLGILGTGSKGIIEGDPYLANVESDLRVTLTDGTKLDVDLTGYQTVQQVISGLDGLHRHLSIEINTTGTGLVLTDSAGGSGNLQVQNLNGSDAATNLGFTSEGTGNPLQGTSIVSKDGAVTDVTLDGRNDNDELIGTDNDDQLTGGGGGDTITGRGGTDTLVETDDTDFVLTEQRC